MIYNVIKTTKILHINSWKGKFTEAPIEAILKVDLYGTAVLLEEVGKVIKKGGVGGATASYYYGKMC